MTEFEKWSNETEYQRLEDLLYLISKDRADNFEVDQEDYYYLENLLAGISCFGDLPEGSEVSDGPHENIPDNVSLVIDGFTMDEESESYISSYIQWGNESNTSCIHLGMLGENFTFFPSKKAIFSHSLIRDLDADEISILHDHVMRSRWFFPEFMTPEDFSEDEIIIQNGGTE